MVNSGRCLSSALSRGGVEKLSERLAKFLNHRSIHRDKQTQQECAALYVNTALGLNLANTKKDMQDWITTRSVKFTKNTYHYSIQVRREVVMDKNNTGEVSKSALRKISSKYTALSSDTYLTKRLPGCWAHSKYA